MGDNISEDLIKSHMPPGFQPVFEIHDSIDSTNLRAKELVKSGAQDLTVVIADHQSAGHGRFGRAFFSPAGCGIYMTVILRPSISVAQSAAVTSFSAVAVAEAVEKLCGCHVGIKWVNDLFMNGKKICGILTESAADPLSCIPEYVISGIGINVLHTDIPYDLKGVISSVEDESGRQISRNELIAEILNRFLYFTDEVATLSYMEEYRRRSVILGKKVKIVRSGETFDAVARQITDSAALVVERDGIMQTINAGEVSIRF